jgi:hypothetical protein
MLLGLLVVLLLPTFLVIYVLGKYPRNGEPEIHLGPRVYLAILGTICVQCMILSVATLLVEVFDTPYVMSSGDPDLALGLLLGSGVASIMPCFMWHSLKLGGSGRTLRQVVGINAFIAGLFSTLLIVSFFIAMVKGSPMGGAVIFTLAYTGAAVGFTLWLKNLVQGPPGAETAFEEEAPRPVAHEPVAASVQQSAPSGPSNSEDVEESPAEPAVTPEACVVCESDSITELAPGAYKCKACGYEGGPGFAAYKGK